VSRETRAVRAKNVENVGFSSLPEKSQNFTFLAPFFRYRIYVEAAALTAPRGLKALKARPPRRHMTSKGIRENPDVIKLR
jgi:hypothetical protein